MLLRQRIESNFCAIYSTAMLMTLRGRHTTRKQALRIFGYDTNWVPPNHDQLVKELSTIATNKSVRVFSRRFRRPREMVTFAEGSLADKLPLLVTAQCYLPSHNAFANHAFVLTSVSASGLNLLDSLSARNSDGATHNAQLRLDAKAVRGMAPVAGAPWMLDLREPMHFLQVDV